MKYFILVLAVFLSACSTVVPVKQKFPDVPAELKEKCPDLNTIPAGTTAITDMLKTVVQNYSLYYQCSLKQEGWTTWYDEQKKVFDQVNK